jgi:hypothetical protein
MATLNYILTVTGDCSSTGAGAIELLVSGGTPPYTIQWIDPSLPTDNQLVTPILKTGLGAGNYYVRANDSTIPVNNDVYINIPISSGVCASIVATQNTTCSLNNGAVTGTSTSDYSSTSFSLYRSDNTFIQTLVTNQSNVEFGSLTAGTYYMIALDLGGCTGRTPNFIIEESEPLNFGLYSVPDSSCGGSSIGKIFITGLTGQPPFTYLWSNTFTTSSITGLTPGIYSVQVTDGYGCNLSKSIEVVEVPPLGFGIFTATEPTCFLSNGVINLTVTGGTAPYYYSASTGNVLISYSKTFSLSGLSSGNYSFLVTDAGLCTINVGTSLSTPLGIASVNVSSQNSTCSSVNGSITVSVVGGVTPYVYTLIYPDGNVISVSNNQTSQLFSNLSGGTYTVAVQDNSGCSYMQEQTLITENKFTIATEVTGTTCGQNNGVIFVTSSTGSTLPLDFSLDGTTNIIDTNLSAVTFSNITAGQHTITVTDATGCVQSSQVFVSAGVPLNYSLYSTSCGDGQNGSITTFINSGTPPFNFNWSNNVPNNPQQIQVSGLTAGTYSLTVIDSDGCSLLRSTTITCDTNYTSYQSYVMGAEVFNIQTPTKYGLLQMLNEGYVDLTSGNTSCTLISAIFTINVSVNPLNLTTSQQFFTSTSLVQAPSDNLYYDTLKNLLLSIPGVGSVTIDQLNNQITIATVPNNTTLNGQEIVVDLNIVYDIMCLS